MSRIIIEIVVGIFILIAGCTIGLMLACMCVAAKNGSEIMDKPNRDIFDYIEAIPEFTDKGVEHKSVCPCGGELISRRNVKNGHLHCECKKCGFKLHE